MFPLHHRATASPSAAAVRAFHRARRAPSPGAQLLSGKARAFAACRRTTGETVAQVEGGLPQPPLGQSRQDTTSHRSPIPNADNHIPAFFPRQPCNSGVMPGNEGGNAFEYRKVKQHATHSGETGSGSIPFPIAFSSSIRIPIAIWMLGNSKGRGACGGIPLFQYRCHAAAFVEAPDAVCVPIECFMYDSTFFCTFFALLSTILAYIVLFIVAAARSFRLGGYLGESPLDGWLFRLWIARGGR